MEKRFRFLMLAVLTILLLLLSGIAVAADVPDTTARPADANDPLVRVLVAKGILTAEEARVLAAAPASQQQSQLVQLLLKKGVLSTSDLAGFNTSNERTVTPVSTSSSAMLKPAVVVETVSTQAAAKPAAPPAPPVVPGVAPIRVLPIDTPKRDGLIPALKLGPVKVTPYGYVKMSAVHDTSQPRGDDFPLPGFIFGDTGPNAAPEFHVKARNARIGSNFEWIDRSEKLTVTGKLEFDFEGNYTAVDNRNVSSARSSQPSLRLAFGRLDYAVTPTTTVYGVFGQDWTPFGSSTLPNTIEGTGVGISFGSLYERAPLVKGGFVHNFGGSRTFKWLTEVAAVSPFFGNVPSGSNFQIPGTVSSNNSNANVFTVTGCATAPCGTVAITQIANTGLGLANQLAFGERQGADSARPEVEARVALQFQLDKAKGVAPAQLIVAGVQGQRTAIVLASNVPTLSTAQAAVVCPPPAAPCPAFFRDAFGPAGTVSHGVRVSSDRYGINPSIQLPTRWFTLLASYYHGADLRWFFAGELFSFYNNDSGFPAGTRVVAPSIDGSAAVVFGKNANGVASVAQQKPIRTTGGFVELGLPLSRWAHANPEGRHTGWTMNLHYGIDDTKASDVRKVAAAGGRDKSDWAFANLQYKINNWVTLAYEESYYRTRAIPNPATGSFAATLFKGNPSRVWQDVRSEFATIFTF